MINKTLYQFLEKHKHNNKHIIYPDEQNLISYISNLYLESQNSQNDIKVILKNIISAIEDYETNGLFKKRTIDPKELL